MNRLIWSGAGGLISDSEFTVKLAAKPVLEGVAFDALYYEQGTNEFIGNPDGTRSPLTEEQKITIEAYIATFDFSVATKHYVDDNGVYLGVGFYGGHEVPGAPPTSGCYYYDLQGAVGWVMIHAVNEAGEYLGSVPYYSAPQIVPSAPPSPYHRWINGGWMDSRTVEELRAVFTQDVEKAAEKTRERYITVTSGMDSVYRFKLEDAEAYQADPSLTAVDVPFVEKERLAMAETNPGATLADAAQFILTTAARWKALVAEIEAVRRVGKERLKKAATTSEAYAAHEWAIQAFGQDFAQGQL